MYCVSFCCYRHNLLFFKRCIIGSKLTYFSSPGSPTWVYLWRAVGGTLCTLCARCAAQSRIWALRPCEVLSWLFPSCQPTAAPSYVCMELISFFFFPLQRNVLLLLTLGPRSAESRCARRRVSLLPMGAGCSRAVLGGQGAASSVHALRPEQQQGMLLGAPWHLPACMAGKWAAIRAGTCFPSQPQAAARLR